MRTPKRVLLVRTDRLGDVILSTPVIENLRKCYPQSYIAFMCRPYTKPAVEGNPYLDEIIVYDKYGIHKSIFSSLQFAWKLRKKRFDLALLLHPTVRVHLISFIAGIPQRVGWARKGSFLLTKRLAHTKQKGQKHEVEYTLDILRVLDIPICEVTLFFPVKEEKEQEIAHLLQTHNVSADDTLIVIHPSASCASKCWAQGHFSLLITCLKKAVNPKIAVISSFYEKMHGEQIVKDHPDVLDLRGKLDITGVAALLNRAHLFISNDSGPVHIAASVKTPVISLFGRKDPGLSPQRWRPLGVHSFFIHKDVGCCECKAHNCEKGFLCLEAISPQEVCELAQEILKRTLRRPPPF